MIKLYGKESSAKKVAKHIVTSFAEMATEDWFQMDGDIDRYEFTDEEYDAVEKEIDLQFNRVKKLLK